MGAISTEQPERSSFLKLPIEIRLIIYKLALQDTLTSPDLTRPGASYPRCRGALALLLTNKLIRAESAKEMQPIVKSEHERLSAYAESLIKEPNAKVLSLFEYCDARWNANNLSNAMLLLKNALATS